MLLKRIIVSFFILTIYGCSINKVENHKQTINEENDVIYEVLKGNLFIQEKKYKLAANAYEKALEVNYNYNIALSNLEIYLSKRDIYNIKKTYEIIKKNNDENRLSNSLNIYSKMKLNFFIKNYMAFENNLNDLFEDKNNKINNFYYLLSMIKNENFNDFNKYITKKDFKNKDLYLSLFFYYEDKEKTYDIISKNLKYNKNDLNWNIINIIANNEKTPNENINSYMKVSKNINKKEQKIDLLKKALFISLNEENYEMTLKILDNMIMESPDFKYKFTKLDFLYYLEKDQEFNKLYLELFENYTSESEQNFINLAYISYLEKNNKNTILNNYINRLSESEKENFLYYIIKNNIFEEKRIEDYLLNSGEKGYYNVLTVYSNLKNIENFIFYYNKYKENYSENKYYDLLLLSLSNYELLYKEGVDYYNSGVLDEYHPEILNLIAYNIAKNATLKEDLELAKSMSLEALESVEELSDYIKYSYYDTLAIINFKLENYEEAYNIMKSHIINVVPYILIDKEVLDNYKLIKEKI